MCSSCGAAAYLSGDAIAMSMANRGQHTRMHGTHWARCDSQDKIRVTCTRLPLHTPSLGCAAATSPVVASFFSATPRGQRDRVHARAPTSLLFLPVSSVRAGTAANRRLLSRHRCRQPAQAWTPHEAAIRWWTARTASQPSTRFVSYHAARHGPTPIHDAADAADAERASARPARPVHARPGAPNLAPAQDDADEEHAEGLADGARPHDGPARARRR